MYAGNFAIVLEITNGMNTSTAFTLARAWTSHQRASTGNWPGLVR